MYRKRKKIVNKYKIKSKYLFALLCMISIFLIFNDIGIIQWIKLSKLKENSLIQVQALLDQQIQLKEEIFKLETDEEYLEAIARERFLMVKEGEKVFRVIDTKQIK